jgi:hypothetical protein
MVYFTRNEAIPEEILKKLNIIGQNNDGISEALSDIFNRSSEIQN